MPSRVLFILLIITSLTSSLNEAHSHHLRHHQHLRFNDYSSHGHHFYRHKRKYHEEHEIEPLHWPMKKESVMEGDVILVHEREDNATCGPIMPQGGIQALEAMLFTLDRINEMKFLGNIKIGAHILDDCDKDTYGLEMAVDFIKGECGSENFLVFFFNFLRTNKFLCFSS
jgi:hypothetical protein